MATKKPVFTVKDAKFEAFALNIGDLTDDPDAAAALLRSTLAEADVLQALEVAPTGWQIERLGARGDYLAVPEGVTVSPARAWQAVRVLREKRALADAEPMFLMPDIDAMQPQKAKLAGVLFEDSHIPATDNAFEWSLEKCAVREAWNEALANGWPDRGAGIRIAHPDTGYTDHAEFNLPGRLLIDAGFNFFEDNSDPRDLMTGSYPGHGTATGSVIISDEGPQQAGAPFVSGVAPKASLVPLRVKDSVIHVSYRELCKAIYFAVDQAKCHIISMSLGGPFRSRTLQNALRHAVENGVISFAAAGNNVGFVVYPARFDETIAMAATNVLDAIWAGSSSGDDVDMSAPGESVWRARAKPNGDFTVERSSGTSYATATTAGICALWLARHGRDALIQRYGAHRLPGVFKELLMRTARTPAGWDTSRFGAGIPRAVALLKAPLPHIAPAGGLQSVKPARTVRRPGNEFDWVASYFPAVDRARLRQTVARMLHSDEDGLEGVLDAVGAEFIFHSVLDPNVYEFVVNQSKGKAGTLSSLRSLGVAKSSVPRAPVRGVSKQLRKRLGG